MIKYPIDDELVPSLSGLPQIDRTKVDEARRIAKQRRAVVDSGGSLENGVTMEDDSCRGFDGHAVGLRVYRPDRCTNRGAIYHVHGGGFILGDVAMSHRRNLELARELGSVVVSVEYRLAPEWPFPTPVQDVYSGLVWVHERAGDLDIDPSLVVLHGVSAGGALAASTALMARDLEGPPVRFLFLASPILDDRLVSPSSRLFVNTPALQRGDIEVCWDAYLGEIERGSDAVPPYAAPARAQVLADLPPTYVSVAEFDPLRDDALEYARSLMAAGVSVEVHLFPGTYHGSSAVRDAAVSQRELAEEVVVLSTVVGRPPDERHRT